MRKSKSTILCVILKPLLFGVLIGSGVCVVVLLLFAFSATVADVPYAMVVPLALVAVSFGAFCGAFAAARFAGRNGWLIGLLTSFALFLLSIISGWRYFGLIDTGFVVIKMIILLSVGVLGGVISINSRKRRA